MDVQKKDFVVFNRVTGKLIRINFGRYLDIVSVRDKNGVMVVKPERFWVYLREIRERKNS